MHILSVNHIKGNVLPSTCIFMKSEVTITLCCQLCSTHYQPVWIENYLKSKCIIEVAKSLLQRGSHHVQPPNWHFSLSAKMNGIQRRVLVSPHTVYQNICQLKRVIYETTNYLFSYACYICIAMKKCFFKTILWIILSVNWCRISYKNN